MKQSNWKLIHAARRCGVAILLTAVCLSAFAQDGNAGINEANQKVRSYFDSRIKRLTQVRWQRCNIHCNPHVHIHGP